MPTHVRRRQSSSDLSVHPVGGAINYATPIDVDETKCWYCGVCVMMCPFNALTLKVDNQERLPILEKEGFPQYDIKAEIDDEKCVRCTICEEVCPT